MRDIVSARGATRAAVSGAGSAACAAGGTRSRSRAGSRASSGATCAPSRTPAAPHASPTTTAGTRVDDVTTPAPDGASLRGRPGQYRPRPRRRCDAARQAPPVSFGPLDCVALGPDAPTASGRPLRRAPRRHCGPSPPCSATPRRQRRRVAGHAARRSTPRPVPRPYCVPMGEAPGEDSRFESAMRHSAIGMSLVAPDGTFLEVNAALCTMLGRGEAELPGHHLAGAHPPRRPGGRRLPRPGGRRRAARQLPPRQRYRQPPTARWCTGTCRSSGCEATTAPSSTSSPRSST